MTKAIALISGGLDSTLAAKLIQNQGIEVLGLCFKSAFFGAANAIKMCNAAGIPLKIIDFTNEHIEMTKNPKHGYGKNMNPCIDCHALMLKMAGNLMEDMGADFLVTGEVLNQRPMSQTRQSLDIVKRESTYGSKILRPLCAKNLRPTKMEEEGLVDRERLLDIQGKSRKAQFELAEKLGIKDYPSPAGGCKLTEPNFSNRLRDLYKYKKDFDIDDIEMLKYGRHFRLSPDTKAISTRDIVEYEAVKGLLKNDDYIFDTAEYNGSTVILRGTPKDNELTLAASITARYGKGCSFDKVTIKFGKKGDTQKQLISVSPAKDEEFKEFML